MTEFFELLSRELNITLFKPVSLLSNESQVVGIVEFEAVARRRGRIIQDRELHVFTFKDGKDSTFNHVVDTHHHWQSLY